MNAVRVAPIAALAALALSALTPAQAQPFGHPAMGGVAAVPAIDANTFIVAHPAGLALRGGHANHAHPADVTSHQQATLDPNQFLVQPPASTRWVATPATSPATLTASR